MSRTRKPIDAHTWFSPLFSLIQANPNCSTQFLANQMNKPTQASTIRRYLYRMRGQGVIEMSGTHDQQRWKIK